MITLVFDDLKNVIFAKNAFFVNFCTLTAMCINQFYKFIN